MSFQAALVKEQGVTFAVAIVRSHVLQSPTQRAEAQGGFGAAFPGVPVVLMAQDSRGTPTYWGRPDIVRYLASIPVKAIPWREWTAA